MAKAQIAIDWNRWESLMVEGAEKAAREVMSKAEGQTFYAMALDEFYAEEDGVIALPCLAANSLEEPSAAPDALEWNSADWPYRLIPYATPELKAAQAALVKLASSRSVKHWHEVHERFMAASVGVARALHHRLKDHPQTAEDFCVLVMAPESEDYTRLIQQCLTPELFAKLFPDLLAEQQSAAGLKNISLDKKLQAYRHDMGEYEKELLKLGSAAIPLLLDALNDEDEYWQAADLLGKLGIPDQRVIAVLRERTIQGSSQDFHEPAALAMLGDTDFLLGRVGKAENEGNAVDGLCRLYSAAVDDCLKEISLDYRPLEILIAKKGAGWRREPPFELWKNPREISTADVEEALRGLESPYGMIREHAVVVLGKPRLGKKAGQRILPALAARLKDSEANLRRLALLQMTYWKKAALPHLPAMRELLTDEDIKVRDTARLYVKQMESLE